MGAAAGISRTSAVLALVVVLLLVLLASHVGDAPRHLAGFWVGEETFMRQSGLQDMYLYVGQAPSGFFGALTGVSRYDGFLVMVGDGDPPELVCNQPVEIKARFGWGLRRRDVYSAPVWLTPDDAEACPLTAGRAGGQLRLTLSPAKGTLALDDGDQVLAVLVKDAATTAQLELSA